jgi:hypothetical protein
MSKRSDLLRRLFWWQDSPPKPARPMTNCQQYELLDQVSLILASQLPRRQVFKLIGVTLAGAALANVGIKPAWARSNCFCNGEPLQFGEACCSTVSPPQPYHVDTACCTSAGVQQKYPIKDLAACPNRVPHPGHVPTSNGCTLSPDSFGAADFTPCCNGHDICYDTCNSNKATCDSTFLTCLQSACQAAYGSAPIRLSACLRVAQAYSRAVSSVDKFYNDAQKEACDCCAGDQPCCPSGQSLCEGVCCDPGEECVNGQCTSSTCTPGTCGTFTNCSGSSTCYCFPVAEGGGACAQNYLCAGAQPCSSSSQCGAGQVCTVNTCCGAQGYCTTVCSQTQNTLTQTQGLVTGGPTAAGQGAPFR